MSDHTQALRDSVAAACEKHSTPDAIAACSDGGWNEALWKALEQVGVTTLSIPEANGGVGGDVADVVTVLDVLGENAGSVPFAETVLLGGWLLADCGAVLPVGTMTAAVAGSNVLVQSHGKDMSISGRVPRVSWARWAEHVVLLVGDKVVVLGRDDYTLAEGTNIAGEPRDDVLIGSTVPAARVHGIPGDGRISAESFRRRAALGRAALMGGASRRALQLSIEYATEREQFGRPIAAFQAVQQHLAAMAGEVLLTRVTTEGAALAIDTGVNVEVAVASAKVISGQAAGLVSSLAHQVHGAIGFTEEHALHRSTARMWAWRDEHGNEDDWASVVGTLGLAGGTAGLWPLITGVPLR